MRSMNTVNIASGHFSPSLRKELLGSGAILGMYG